MRCRITASRRASATIAFFIPRCLAIFIAQALSQDHFTVRTSMLCRPIKVAAVALANKIARMAWAMMVRGERFKEPKLLPAA